jgi:pimeloyl-ACP methyl ester carboxylesterase
MPDDTGRGIRTKVFGASRREARLRTDYDVTGDGPEALLLPAFSSISERAEMHPLARLLKSRYRCVIPDWPGFGRKSGPATRLTPAILSDFLRVFTAKTLTGPALVIAAGHSAAYVITLAREAPRRFARIVLVAPTWRGPLPTAMGEQRRSLCGRIRGLIEMPVAGPLVYGLSVNRLIMRRMMRAHVYGSSEFVTGRLVSEKAIVTRRPRARFATSAFVTGGLDLVHDRSNFLRLFRPLDIPVLVLIGTSTPPKSRKEMEALAAMPGIQSSLIPGSLAAHEEHPEAIAAAIEDFLGSSPGF